MSQKVFIDALICGIVGGGIADILIRHVIYPKYFDKKKRKIAEEKRKA